MTASEKKFDQDPGQIRQKAAAFERAFQDRLRDDDWAPDMAARVIAKEAAVRRFPAWRRAGLAAAAGLLIALGVLYSGPEAPETTAEEASWLALWTFELDDGESLAYETNADADLAILAAFDD